MKLSVLIVSALCVGGVGATSCSDPAIAFKVAFSGLEEFLDECGTANATRIQTQSVTRQQLEGFCSKCAPLLEAVDYPKSLNCTTEIRDASGGSSRMSSDELVDVVYGHCSSFFTTNWTAMSTHRSNVSRLLASSRSGSGDGDPNTITLPSKKGLPRPEPTSSNAGVIGGVVAGVVVVLLLGIVAYRVYQKRSSSGVRTVLPPANEATPPAGYRSAWSPNHDRHNKSDSRQGRSGGTDSAGRHTTVSTTNGSLSGGGSGKRTAARTPAMDAWNDPAITAVRVPHDAVFFGQLLSRGGYGEVYMGTFKGQTVAIKQLLPERRKDLKQIDDFLREIKLMTSLEHERIIKFIAVAWTSLSDACVVVEYMENGDLRSVLARWNQGQERRNTGFDAEKIKIAVHVTHALTYLHSLQPAVVHRDLKSKNILLDANLDAKLTDFGISRERGDTTMTAGVGSFLWMAPEVMMGKRYNEKADIYSLGVVLSELDTHQLPYFHVKETEDGRKLPEAAILQMVMLGRLSVAFTDRADPELVQLARECVSLDPNERPSAAQVLHRVHQALRRYK